MLVFVAVRLLAVTAFFALRFACRTAVFAWRHPWAFMASLAVLPVLLALPEYLS